MALMVIEEQRFRRSSPVLGGNGEPVVSHALQGVLLTSQL